jgi:hypothetical protein
MEGSLLGPPARRDGLGAIFARSARPALAGLLAGPAILGLASAAGQPLRAGTEALPWLSSLAGFGCGGWMAGRRLGLGPRRTAALAGAFVAAAVFVTPAVRGLHGLTGREPLLAVAGTTLGAFGAGFALAGALASKALRLDGPDARGLLLCAAGGLLGGVFALLPFSWAALRLDVPGKTYVEMALAVAGFLGCLIVPFRTVGAVLDRVRDPEGVARV